MSTTRSSQVAGVPILFQMNRSLKASSAPVQSEQQQQAASRLDLVDERHLRPFTDDQIVDAVQWLGEQHPGREFSAKKISNVMGLHGTPRLGTRSSSRGNWSGKMSPALRIAPALQRLYREGRLHAEYIDYRWVYRRPEPWDRPYVKQERVKREYVPGPPKRLNPYRGQPRA